MNFRVLLKIVILNIKKKCVFIYKKLSVLFIFFNENMCNLIVKKNIKYKKSIKYLLKYLIRFR